MGSVNYIVRPCILLHGVQSKFGLTSCEELATPLQQPIDQRIGVPRFSLVTPQNKIRCPAKHLICPLTLLKSKETK